MNGTKEMKEMTQREEYLQEEIITLTYIKEDHIITINKLKNENNELKSNLIIEKENNNDLKMKLNDIYLQIIVEKSKTKDSEIKFDNLEEKYNDLISNRMNQLKMAEEGGRISALNQQNNYQNYSLNNSGKIMSPILAFTPSHNNKQQHIFPTPGYDYSIDNNNLDNDNKEFKSIQLEFNRTINFYKDKLTEASSNIGKLKLIINALRDDKKFIGNNSFRSPEIHYKSLKNKISLLELEVLQLKSKKNNPNSLMNISTNDEHYNNQNEIISSLKAELMKNENQLKLFQTLKKEHLDLQESYKDLSISIGLIEQPLTLSNNSIQSKIIPNNSIIKYSDYSQNSKTYVGNKDENNSKLKETIDELNLDIMHLKTLVSSYKHISNSQIPEHQKQLFNQQEFHKKQIESCQLQYQNQQQQCNDIILKTKQELQLLSKKCSYLEKIELENSNLKKLQSELSISINDLNFIINNKNNEIEHMHNKFLELQYNFEIVTDPTGRIAKVPFDVYLSKIQKNKENINYANMVLDANSKRLQSNNNNISILNQPFINNSQTIIIEHKDLEINKLNSDLKNLKILYDEINQLHINDTFTIQNMNEKFESLKLSYDNEFEKKNKMSKEINLLLQNKSTSYSNNNLVNDIDNVDNSQQKSNTINCTDRSNIQTSYIYNSNIENIREMEKTLQRKIDNVDLSIKEVEFDRTETYNTKKKSQLFYELIFKLNQRYQISIHELRHVKETLRSSVENLKTNFKLEIDRLSEIILVKTKKYLDMYDIKQKKIYYDKEILLSNAHNMELKNLDKSYNDIITNIKLNQTKDLENIRSKYINLSVKTVDKDDSTINSPLKNSNIIDNNLSYSYRYVTKGILDALIINKLITDDIAIKINNIAISNEYPSVTASHSANSILSEQLRSYILLNKV